MNRELPQVHDMGLVFEWDETKARSNWRKHRVSFGEAATLFDDRLAITNPDSRDPDFEEHFFSVGDSKQGRLIAISHTEIGDRIRIMSARPATAIERRDYEEGR